MPDKPRDPSQNELSNSAGGLRSTSTSEKGGKPQTETESLKDSAELKK